MNKFYLIDKTLGITSFDVLRILKKKLNIKKMGHTGTLDPLASGLVLVAVGNYTKLIPYFEKDTKIYEFELSLDGTTESFDLAEKINFLDKKLQEKFRNSINIEKIEKILKQNFLGIINQVPPKYSAIKINGKRAYKLAREGKEIQMKSRKIEIFEIKILNYNYPKLFLKAKVGAGTYIRSIAYDLGKILGTGAYITKLRRTKIGKLNLDNSQKLEEFDAEKNLDIKDVFKNNNFINLPDNILRRINDGLETFYNFENNEIKDGEEFFVEKDGEITNIVTYSKNINDKCGLLKAKRKI